MERELDALERIYGKPACIASDNGMEFPSRAILKWANDNDIDWHYIDPGKPQQNAFIESFSGGVRNVTEREDVRQSGRRRAKVGALAIRSQQRQTALIVAEPDTRISASDA